MAGDRDRQLGNGGGWVGRAKPVSAISTTPRISLQIYLEASLACCAAHSFCPLPSQFIPAGKCKSLMSGYERPLLAVVPFLFHSVVMINALWLTTDAPTLARFRLPRHSVGQDFQGTFRQESKRTSIQITEHLAIFFPQFDAVICRAKLASVYRSQMESILGLTSQANKDELEGRPLTSLQSVILATGPFVFLWSTLRGYVSRNGPLSFARPLTRFNSQAYALFSLALAYLIVNDVFHFQDIEGFKSSDLAYIYHISKFYEYLDVFNLVASGTAIGSHMAFRHLTMPFLTYFRVLNASDWQLFAFLNCFHHFWMYSYFGGVSSFRPVLPLTGWLQLGAGIAPDIYYIVTQGQPEAAESKNRAISIMLLARYAMLFYEELKGSDARKAEIPEQRGNKKKQ